MKNKLQSLFFLLLVGLGSTSRMVSDVNEVKYRRAYDARLNEDVAREEERMRWNKQGELRAEIEKKHKEDPEKYPLDLGLLYWREDLARREMIKNRPETATQVRERLAQVELSKFEDGKRKEVTRFKVALEYANINVIRSMALLRDCALARSAEMYKYLEERCREAGRSLDENDVHVALQTDQAGLNAAFISQQNPELWKAYARGAYAQKYVDDITSAQELDTNAIAIITRLQQDGAQLSRSSLEKLQGFVKPQLDAENPKRSFWPNENRTKDLKNFLNRITDVVEGLRLAEEAAHAQAQKKSFWPDDKKVAGSVA
ncbi:hypothetical protein A3F06_02270 [candidate division TM6 bacterium RIFCSPHIGHO2_12_FULL_36_22]|nr:MAG: hypothetical protein A3F06_02270 [candidate division TM6 bacterium RIFCSPHIGHO2_12_FULL_36_22]